MGNMTTSNVQDNEILKAIDINDSFDAQITNIAKTMQCLLETKKDFVISVPELVTAHSDNLQDWTINIDSLFAISSYDGTPILETEKTYSAANISKADSFDRIDTVQIRGTYVNTNSEQRAFIDFDTNDKTLNSVFTKRELKMEVQILKNTNASVSAPEHTEGWIKIAEIFVPSSATKIADCTINNISSDVANLENTNWTNEKNATYNVQYISNVNDRYRKEHNANGTHKDKIIHNAQLDIGTGKAQVNNSNIVIGGEVTVCNEGIQASSSTLDAIKTIVSKINGIYQSYKAAGDYYFAREVNIYGNDSETISGDKLKIGINSNGLAYIKIGTKTLFTIKSDGTLSADTTYTPTNNNDLVTKAVTDTINSNLTSVANRVTQLELTNDKTVYANETLSRYKIDSTAIILATTSNISLTGSQRIDNVDTSVNMVVLVKNQTNTKENGIYVVKDDAWIRHSSFNDPTKLKEKLLVINDGKTNKGKIFYCPKVNFTDTTAFGKDEIPFVEYFGSINAIGNKAVIRDSEGHVKASASTNSDDCVVRSEVVSGAMKSVILDYVYPVGSLYWSSKDTNPGTLFGGTWKQIEDTFIFAAGTKSVDATKYKAEGGNSSITLAADNLPQHTHGMEHTHTFSFQNGTVSNHKHGFLAEGDINNHTHEYTPKGELKGGSYTFVGNSKSVTEEMEKGSTGYFDIPETRNDSSVIRSISGVFSKGTGTYGRSIDMTSDMSGARVLLDIQHSHKFLPEGKIVIDEQPSFIGEKDNTSEVTLTFTGKSNQYTNDASSTCSGSGTTDKSQTYTNNNTTKNTSIDITPPYLVRYCWERIK